jgi:hypothetical protein
MGKASHGSSTKFDNSKMTIMGDGSSLVMNLLTLAALAVLAVAKDSAARSFDSLNRVSYMHYDFHTF